MSQSVVKNLTMVLKMIEKEAAGIHGDNWEVR